MWVSGLAGSAWHAWAVLGAPVVALTALRAAEPVAEDGPGAQPARPWIAVGLPGVSAACVLVALAVLAPDAAQAWTAVALFGGLAYLAAFDLRTLSVPVWPTLALAVAGIMMRAVDGLAAAAAAAAAAIVGWAVFRALDLCHLRLRGVSALGSGDALVAAAIGAWMSLENLAWSVAAGCGLMLPLVLWLRSRGRIALGPIPLVPGLAAGALVVFIFSRMV